MRVMHNYITVVMKLLTTMALSSDNSSSCSVTEGAAVPDNSGLVGTGTGCGKWLW